MEINPQRSQIGKHEKGTFLGKLFRIMDFNRQNSEVDFYTSDQKDLIDTLNNARSEWVTACENFEYVQDEQLIDYYIYKIKASELRYQYFIKLAKEKGIKIDVVPNIPSKTI